MQKKFIKIIATVVTVGAIFSLVGCVTQTQTPASSLRFHYRAQGGKEIGLVRAFDDGQRTVLQFITDPPADLRVFDAARLPVTYQRMGQNVILPGLYSSVQVQTGSAAARITSMLPLAARVPARQYAPPAPKSVSAAISTKREGMVRPSPNTFQTIQKQIADLCSVVATVNVQQFTSKEKAQVVQVQSMCHSPTLSHGGTRVQKRSPTKHPHKK